MGIDVLGALRIGGSAASLQRRDQVVLCALAMRPGDVLAADRLAEALWGDEPPRSWSKVVQGCVLRLRRALGVSSIETTAAGYRLTVPDDEIDCRRFEELITRGVSLASTDDFDRAIVAFGRALELWRGHPLEVLDGWSPGRIEAARLDELRRSAEERLLDARLEFGEHREVVGIAEARVAEEPLREHRWATLAVAQYRCGRQAEALRSLNRARQTLVEELGIGPGAEIVELEQSILNQDDALLVTPEPPAIADHCPYKGLAPYDVEDAEGFFGRSEEVAECLQRLRDSPLLVVTGPSGCGKSSLARAGLVPALVRAGHRVAVFVPGNDPQAAMEEVLASCDRSPVLVVDQFEEAFLLTGASGDRARSFCARLAAHAITVAPVIVTVRADHVAGLGVDLEFARLAERGLHIVTALSGEPLRQAIEGPAALAGLRIEPGLVDLLVRDCEGEPGALPLLSHALAETWQRRDGRVLTVEAYRATGEIRGAVARSADRLYESLPAEQRAKLRSLLLRLVSSTPDGQPVRSRIATRALSGDIERERVLALLVRARLVTAEEDSVELAHEALARAWPRLRSWLDEDAAGQRILRHLSAAADGWESLGRPESELYRGARLEAALEWRAASSPDLTDEESEFLDASVAAVESEGRRVAERAGAHARQRRRQRAALAGVAVLLLAAVGGGLVAYNESRATARDQHAAEARALATTSAALRTTQPDLAALLAVEAYRIAPSAAAESSLFGTFTANPGLQRTVHTPLTLGGVPAAAFVPGTDTLAVANVHGGIHLIDLASGEHEVLGPTANEPGGRAALDVAANGRYVALIRFTFSDRSRSVLTVWDLGTGQQRFDPVRLPYRSSSVAISDDGALVAMGGVHAEPSQLRDGVTGELLWEIEAVPDAENEAALATASVEFAPDGRLVVGSRAGAIRFLDPGTRAELRRIDGPQGFSEQALLFDPEGRNLVTVGTDGFLAYNVNSGLPMSGQHLHPDCTSPALVPGRRALICLGTPGTVLAFDINSGAELDMPGRGYPDDVCALAVSADGARLVEVAACHDSATFVPWRLDGGGPASRLAYPTSAMHAVQGFGFAGDSSAIVAWQGQGEQSATLAIDPATGDVIDEFPDAYGLVPTEDPNVVVAVFGDTTVGTYDVVRHAVVERVDVGFANDMLDVQGDRVAVGGGSVDDFVPVVQVQVVDFAADPQLGALIDGTGEFEIVDFFLHAEHGLFLAISFDDSDRVQVERRDPMTGEVLGEPAAGYRDLVVGGGVVFLITAEGAMVEVDPTTLEPTGAPFGEVRLEDWVPVDPHGRRLAVVSDTPSLHFYDVASRTQLGDTIELGELALGWSGGAFSSDGKQFAVDTEQGIVVWDLDPDHWVRGACELAGRNLTGPEWDQYLGDAGSYRRTCPAFGEPDATADTEPLGTPAE